MSLTSELLPEPLAPVTQTNAPSGISTSMFLRLLWRAPTTRSLRGEPDVLGPVLERLGGDRCEVSAAPAILVRLRIAARRTSIFRSR